MSAGQVSQVSGSGGARRAGPDGAGGDGGGRLGGDGGEGARVMGGVALITGNEEFLAERRVDEIRDAVRRVDSEAEISQTSAGDLTMATLGELSAPSLFSTTRCVVVRRLEDLPEESVAGMLGYAADPSPDIALVLVHSGGQKGTGLLTKLRKLPTVTEHKHAAPTAREYPAFVVQEMRRHRVRIDQEAAGYLVQAVGQDLRALASAADQLASDLGGPGRSGAIGTEEVRTYYGGRAEAKSFTIADHALFGRVAPALEELRWALQGGMAPVLVTSALAGNLRQLVRYANTRRGRPGDMMREIGVPGWKLDILRDQSRGWDSAGLAAAVQVVARTDADVKGQASDASYALERMVLTVAGLRVGRR